MHHFIDEDASVCAENEADKEKIPVPKKRARKGHSEPHLWVTNRNKKLREEGK
jgi:hypothetical protein